MLQQLFEGPPLVSLCIVYIVGYSEVCDIVLNVLLYEILHLSTNS